MLIAYLFLYLHRPINNSSPQQYKISTVLHELAHIRHYDANTTYYQMDTIIRESYASYVGWYLGESYYLDKGYIKSSNAEQINLNGRQYWTKNSTHHNYSPLFVDLLDDFNQHTTASPECVDDAISEVPFSVIEGMSHCLTVSACHSFLNTYTGVYFNTIDLNTIFSYY